MSNVDELHTRVNNLEQYSKRNNLLLHGIPESFTEVVLRGDEADEHINSSEHLLSKVSDVISEHLHIDIHRSDLLAFHRLSSKEKVLVYNVLVCHVQFYCSSLVMIVVMKFFGLRSY